MRPAARPPWRPTRWQALAALVVLAVGAAAVLAWQRLSGDVAPAAAQGTISVSHSHCGEGWTDPRPGQQTFQLRNTDTTSEEVALVETATGAVYGEVEGLGPGVTRPMRVDLGAGTYAFRCAPEGAAPISGPRVHITGTGTGGPAVVPVTSNDLLGPVRQYQAYVAAGLDEVVTRTAALRDAVRAGDLDAARAAWLPAHLAYERLGAAYGAFGDVADRIDGRPDGLPGGVHDPGFTGFHRVEYGLWHGEDAAGLAAAADALAADTAALRADFPNQQVDPNDLGRRAHEILEDTERFELTGAADAGSGTSLATAAANLDGTREVLAVLRPLLAPRYPAMSEVDAWMDRLARQLAAAARPGGGWTPLDQLPAGARARINGATGQLLELLAPIAEICQARRTS
ncbi:EfeM/EfeO family lipoprotein [Gandjariella thermophila]|uniref:Iron transporter n=1 Tax=Gandjariella thermophila TaxID=1931992 RepID=A0A4D4IZ63_9PSEU|nr:EfeM/EfeO family lipoprotein [Gandjariella thermophila]GDY28394.1 iron transporter [Gandjariella thermophila]